MSGGRPFKTAPIGWFCNACGTIGIEHGICRGEHGITHSPQARMAYYRVQDVDPLVEAADALGEALERISYSGEVGDVEDVDTARHDAAAALNLFRSAAPPSSGGK
jgi:hypothetical protein